jgi:hypothetical protein
MSIILHRDGLHELHRGTADGEQVTPTPEVRPQCEECGKGQRPLIFGRASDLLTAKHPLFAPLATLDTSGFAQEVISSVFP